ncbi:MAG: glutaminyl-peptide cyclotransferase [Halieaceae bacterium]
MSSGAKKLSPDIITAPLTALILRLMKPAPPLLRFLLLVMSLSIVCLQSSRSDEIPTDSVPLYRAIVADVKPFPRENFTQGLEISEGELYVSSGLYGKSAVRVYDWDSMTRMREAALAPQFFAEGLTRIDDKLYLLTWREGRLLVLDPLSLEIQAAMGYQGEGWGLAHHDQSLWLSDGSQRLIRLDLAKSLSQDHSQNAPQQSKAARNTPTVTIIDVTLEGKPLKRLNELEWVDGELWANIWQTDTIARIDPHSGEVVGLIDASNLLSPEDRLRDTDVLNGIARDPETGKIWVTGKRWPKIFQIILEPAD